MYSLQAIWPLHGVGAGLTAVAAAQLFRWLFCSGTQRETPLPTAAPSAPLPLWQSVVCNRRLYLGASQTGPHHPLQRALWRAAGVCPLYAHIPQQKEDPPQDLCYQPGGSLQVRQLYSICFLRFMMEMSVHVNCAVCPNPHFLFKKIKSIQCSREICDKSLWIVSGSIERLSLTLVTWRVVMTQTTWPCMMWTCCQWTRLWTMVSQKTVRFTWPRLSCILSTTTKPTWEESCCSPRSITSWYRVDHVLISICVCTRNKKWQNSQPSLESPWL